MTLRDQVEDFIRKAVATELITFSGNQTKAAESLGISRSTLRKYMPSVPRSLYADPTPSV